MGRRLVGALILLCACERGEIVVGNRWVRGGSFSDDRGMMAFPYSDVRFRVDRNFLYVILYAGDEDIRSRDKFDVVVAPLRFEMGPVLSTAPPEVRIDRDIDGSVDQPGDLDEEWRIELAIPLMLIQTQPARLRVERCDSPRTGGRHCGHFAATLELRPS
jgi:hypothetical protein